MGSTGFNVLAGIVALVVIVLIGLSIAGAPQYQAGDPRSPGYSSQTSK
jgi:hypothetical protein